MPKGKLPKGIQTLSGITSLSERGEALLRSKAVGRRDPPTKPIKAPSVQQQVASKILEEGHTTRSLSGKVSAPSTLERAARISKKAAMKGIPLTVESAFGRLARKAGKLGGKLGVLGILPMPSQLEEYKERMKPLHKREQERSARRI